jgi:hypothetical protein
MRKIHIDIGVEKQQVVVTFRNNGIKVLRFFHIEIVSYVAQHLVFFHKKAYQTKRCSPGKVKFLQN